MASWWPTTRSRTGPNHPVSGTAVVTSNVWHHAAVTYDATTGTWKLYLDGVLDRTLVLASAFQPNASQHPARRPGLVADDAPARAAGFFNGALDEARIWNVARSDAQIAANFDKTLTAGSGLSPATASTRAPARRPPRASPAHPTARSPTAPLLDRRSAAHAGWQPGAGLQHRHHRPDRRRGRHRVSSTPTRPMPISTR